MPGIEVALLVDGGIPVPTNIQGDLCLKPGWSSMFVTYLNAEDVYQNKFRAVITTPATWPIATLKVTTDLSVAAIT